MNSSQEIFGAISSSDPWTIRWILHTCLKFDVKSSLNWKYEPDGTNRLGVIFIFEEFDFYHIRYVSSVEGVSAQFTTRDNLMHETLHS